MKSKDKETLKSSISQNYLMMNNFWFKLFNVIGIVIINSIFIEASFFSAIGTTLNNHFNNGSPKSSQDDNNEIIAGMQIKVYKGQSIETTEIIDIPISQPEMMYQYINHSRPLVIYIHGFREYPANESVQTIVAAHLERGIDNMFVLDWSKLASDDYITVFSKTQDISRVFAELFDRLIELGLNMENLHLIGHSLGGQIAGLSGKYSKYFLPRITGLDPAKPGFYHGVIEHIDNSSARFVDIIHTDGGFYGASINTGMVDIFPNGGVRPQPGCGHVGLPLSSTDLCSHWRSWRFYAESIMNPYAFLATQCDNYLNYTFGECDDNQVINIGYQIPTNVRGSFFLKTNRESPYGQNYYE